MNTSIRFLPRQRGAAAVECAIVLPLLVLLLTFFVFYAQVLWHYTVAQKAAYDAARYLSTVTEQEMRDDLLAPAAANIANYIAQAEIAELRPGRGARPRVEIQCGGVRCEGVRGTPLPQTVSVAVRMEMFDDYFRVFNVGRYGLSIVGRAEIRYVGNQ
jgi:cbb3-type cytochrome oxidase subunit 3